MNETKKKKKTTSIQTLFFNVYVYLLSFGVSTEHYWQSVTGV